MLRKLGFVLLAFTAPACQRPHPVTAPIARAAPRAPDLGLPATEAAPALTTTPTAETAPESAVAEEVEPSPNQLVKQARAALDQGDLDTALRLAQRAVQQSPGRSAAWNTLGRVQLRRGDHAAALDSFDQAVEANPSSAWARNNHGLAFLYEGRYDEAVDELEEATDLMPDCGLMWNNLGMAYEHVDRLEEARTAYRRAMNLDHQGAAQNYVRIEGVHSLRHTAQADTPRDDDQDLPMVDHGL